MGYPREFVDRVKKMYPYARGIHEALDANRDDVELRQILSWNSRMADEKLAERLAQAQSAEEVQEIERDASERKRIWEEYKNNYNKWFR